MWFPAYKTTRIRHRIISFSQPWLRPIVRGKAKAKVEFGAKLDLSLDGGFAYVERLSFENFNEASDLVTAVRRYSERNGCYPERMLVDQIYRNRANISYCKARGIRLSGKALGRPQKMAVENKEAEYQDNGDRIAVERSFSLLKSKFHMQDLRTKLPQTTQTQIGIAVIAFNINKLIACLLRSIFIFLKRFGLWWRDVIIQ
jgi:hypothetical protein